MQTTIQCIKHRVESPHRIAKQQNAKSKSQSSEEQIQNLNQLTYALIIVRQNSRTSYDADNNASKIIASNCKATKCENQNNSHQGKNPQQIKLESQSSNLRANYRSAENRTSQDADKNASTIIALNCNATKCENQNHNHRTKYPRQIQLESQMKSTINQMKCNNQSNEMQQPIK